MSKTAKAIENIFVFLAGSAFLGGWFSGLGLLLYQIYNYLKLGFWKGYSVIDLLTFSGIAKNWAVSPSSWLGLHKVLDFFPLSLFLIIAGSIIGAYIGHLAEEQSNL